MGLLDAGGSGWCLRWSATASWVVYDGQHGRCSLVSARGPGDGGEVLKGSRFPGCCSRQLGLPPHGKPRDNRHYRAAFARRNRPEIPPPEIPMTTAASNPQIVPRPQRRRCAPPTGAWPPPLRPSSPTIPAASTVPSGGCTLTGAATWVSAPCRRNSLPWPATWLPAPPGRLRHRQNPPVGGPDSPAKIAV